MTPVLELLAFLVGSAVLIGGLVVFARRARRSGVGSIGNQAMTAVDELFHPTAFEQQVEIQTREEREAPKPIPGDL